MKWASLFILSLSVLFGCKENPKSVRDRVQWPQTCEMCGAEWLVTPMDPNKAVPRTVEWCFRDGRYCEEGFDILMEQIEQGDSEELNGRWLRHCLECKGCRCAAFKPEEWNRIWRNK